MRPVELGRAPVPARTAGDHVFGPRPPQAEAAAAYWDEVEAYRASMPAGLPRRRRGSARPSRRAPSVRVAD